MLKHLKYFFYPVLMSLSLSIHCLSAYSQSTCDEELIKEVDEIKRTAENSLINASSVTKELNSGIELMAFYSEGSLLKISTTDNLSHSEQLFYSGGVLRYYEKSGYLDGKQYFYVYYFSGGKLSCKQNALSGATMEISRKEGKKILDLNEEYLLAVQ